MELKILDFIQTFHTPLLDQIMCLITHLGGGIIWLLLLFILTLVPKTRKTAVIMMIAMVLDVLLCNGLLKNIFCRTRPCDINTSVQLLVSRPKDYSFPSGHTSISFTVAFALYFAKEKRLFYPIVIFASLVAFSRLYLYVHYPTDILGGIVVGAICGYMGYVIVDRFISKKLVL